MRDEDLLEENEGFEDENEVGEGEFKKKKEGEESEGEEGYESYSDDEDSWDSV